MYKLCSLKEVAPGAVVELPPEFQSSDSKNAIVLGLQYDDKRENVVAEMYRKQGREWMPYIHTKPEDSQVKVVEDEGLLKAAQGEFLRQRLTLPRVGMSTGCDPEIFVKHEDGTVFPAWEFMPTEDEARASSKEWLAKKWNASNPGAREFLVQGLGRWNDETDNYVPRAVPSYWDGAQAEFAPWAKNCLETLHCSTREGLRAVLEFARKHDPKAKLTLQNVVELPEAVLKNADDKYIQFHCSQSFNIYGDPGDDLPDPRQYKFRCAGGHIHLGFSRPFTPPAIEQIVRGLDGVLGVIGVSLAAGIDVPERRHTYGRAGEFRLPKHGIEYRTLSNFWLCHPAIAMLVFDLARVVVRFAESGLYTMAWKADEDEIRSVINSCDVDGARKILKRNGAVLNVLLTTMYPPAGGVWASRRFKMRSLAFRTILGGVQVAIPDPFDIEGNWRLADSNRWINHMRGRNESWYALSTGEYVE